MGPSALRTASHSINIGRAELGSKCQGLGSGKGKYVPVERNLDCPAYWAGSSVTQGEPEGKAEAGCGHTDGVNLPLRCSAGQPGSCVAAGASQG